MTEREVLALCLMHAEEIRSEDALIELEARNNKNVRREIGNKHAYWLGRLLGKQLRYVKHNMMTTKGSEFAHDPELVRAWELDQLVSQFEVAFDIHGMNPDDDRPPRPPLVAFHPSPTPLVLGITGRIGVNKALVAFPPVFEGQHPNTVAVDIPYANPSFGVHDLCDIIDEVAAGHEYPLPKLDLYEYYGALTADQVARYGIVPVYGQFEPLPDAVSEALGVAEPVFSLNWLDEPIGEKGYISEVAIRYRDVAAL